MLFEQRQHQSRQHRGDDDWEGDIKSLSRGAKRDGGMFVPAATAGGESAGRINNGNGNNLSMGAVADTASISSAKGGIGAVDLAALAIEGAVMTTITTAFVFAAVSAAESATAIIDPTVAIEITIESRAKEMMRWDRARGVVPRVTMTPDRDRATVG
jgi:hypothetical protein